MRAVFQAITGLAVVGAAFGCGMALQTYLYKDACLDMGGGQNPGGHPICVVVTQPDWITIGPLTLKPDQVELASVTASGQDTSSVSLKISPQAADALNGLSANALGEQINISVGDTVVSTVTVRDTIANRSLIVVIPNEAAARLAGVY